MNQDHTRMQSTTNEARGTSLLLTLLGIAGKALVNHLITRAQQAQPPAPGANESPALTPTSHAPAASSGGLNHLNEVFAIDQQRVEETRHHLGDEAAAALERANKEEYARMLRDTLRDSSDSMREIARNLGR
jgi:hypothetical protein